MEIDGIIRPFEKADTKQVIRLLRLNTPRYFHVSEENDLVDYLNLNATNYFVYEFENKIIGSGGINYFRDTATARISWDMVHPDFQGYGIGKKITFHRINIIKKEPDIQKIAVRTTQLTYRFYEKFGFRLEHTEKDFWAKGFDLYLLTYPLS
jgi:N-acetylglutamate synthase-like GNAT family acetyltransferase